MRIDLVTPFAEKDAVKSLGARWDPARKTWYVQDVSDLTPFQRWIPDRAARQAPDAAPSTARPSPTKAERPATALPAASAATSKGTVTESVIVLAHCGCDVLPWEACVHHS